MGDSQTLTIELSTRELERWGSLLQAAELVGCLSPQQLFTSSRAFGTTFVKTFQSSLPCALFSS